MKIIKKESLTRSMKPIALGIALLAASVTAPTMAADTLAEAFSGGKAFANLRLRYENAQIENGNNEDANALTLRTTFGYETAEYKGFSVFVEAEDVREVFGVNDFSVPNIRPNEFDVIADADTTEIEQGYIQYKSGGFTGRLGRQTITIDNHRFVGHVGWRQDRQSFDALNLNYNQAGFDVKAIYIQQRNRIFGEVADIEAEDFLFNASYKAGFGKLTAYAYLIDDNDGIDDALDTFGLSFAGSTKFSDTGEISYRAEFATQENDGNNTEADYFHVNAGVKVGPAKFSLGYESLGSDDGIDGFATPLATLHGFNGWADVFLNTPNIGLEDAYASLDLAIGGPIGGKFKLVYHDFSSDVTDAFGDDDLGDEIDVQYTRDFGDHIYTGIKYASYSAGSAIDTIGATEPSQSDTDRFWLWAGLKFK